MTRALVWLLIAATPPETVLIATPRGVTSVPVTSERGSAAVAAPLLAEPLRLSVILDGSRVLVNLRGSLFVFQLGAPYVRSSGTVYGLVDGPYTARDTVFLPLVWLTDCVPRALGPLYRWDAAARRLEERPVADGLAATAPPGPARPGPTPPAAPAGAATPAPPVAAAPAPATASPAPLPRDPAPNPLTGLRLPHAVVIDAGHGGADPGNPGHYFPSGLVEKDITLAIARLLRAELSRRAIGAALTRTRDTLIDLADRGASCRADCDLFVSIHVNAMPAGRGAERSSGVETYFLSEAKNEDQQRVANMENDAIRFETASTAGAKGPVNFILKDLQLNEYLRESATLAQLVQARVAAVHPGGDHGVQQAGFTVLTTARRPAILVETGFATNRTDAAFLASGLGEHKIASAIADGIVQYLQEFEHKVPGGTRAGGR